MMLFYFRLFLLLCLSASFFRWRTYCIRISNAITSLKNEIAAELSYGVTMRTSTFKICKSIFILEHSPLAKLSANRIPHRSQLSTLNQ